MDEHLYTVIAKVLSREASGKELEEMKRWLAADPERLSAFEEISLLWHQADSLSDGTAFDTGAAWKKVAGATGVAAMPVQKRISLIPAWKTGIAVAAACILGIFIYHSFFSNDLIEVIASNSHKTITLPDDSHVLLRAGSTLSYPSRFAANERHVSLKGEAFFEVARDAQKPFTIDAEAASVKVLGTSFNVLSGRDFAVVTVATGKVEMTASDNSKSSVILTPREQGNLKNGALTKGYVSSDSYLYWKTGVVNFRDQPFSSVIHDMEDITETSIKFDASVTADAQRQVVNNVSYRKDQPLEEMLEELCQITGCRIEKGNNGYIIRAR